MENQERLEHIIIEYSKTTNLNNSHINFGLNELVDFLKEKKGKVDEIFWRIYFDLLRFDNNREKFEIAADSYTKVLNKTPPSWFVVDELLEEHGRVNKFNLRDFDSITKEKVKDFVNNVKNGEFSRIDFSQTTDLNMEKDNLKGVITLTNLLFEIKGCYCQIIGVINLLNYLEEKIKQPNVEKEYWSLLLALYQSIGYENEYENIALDYIDKYEETTPEYNKNNILKQQNYDNSFDELESFELPKIVEVSDIVNLTIFIENKLKKENLEIIVDAKKTQFIQYSALEELAKYIIEGREKLNKKIVVFENLAQIIASSIEIIGVDKNLVLLKTIKYG